MAPTASERLHDARQKVERAKQHIVDLNGVIRSFLDSTPYKVGPERDPQTREMTYCVTSVAPTPPAIPVLAGEVFQHLRSALDYLACQLVRANRKRPTTQTAYPIADSAAKYKSFSPKKVAGMSAGAVSFIEATKPYKGGINDLWVLHKLNNIDKHRLLLTVGSALRSANIGAHMGRTMQKLWGELVDDGSTVPTFDLYVKPADRVCPLQPGDVLFRDGPETTFNEKMDFRFEIALNEKRVAEGQPLLETVDKTLHLVEGLLNNFVVLL
jgi:hypothetical protein